MTEEEKHSRIAELTSKIDVAQERARRETSRWRWERKRLKISLAIAQKWKADPEALRAWQAAGRVGAAETFRRRRKEMVQA